MAVYSLFYFIFVRTKIQNTLQAARPLACRIEIQGFLSGALTVYVEALIETFCLVCLSAPGAPPSAVAVTVDPKQNHTVHLTWEPPPPEAHNGIIQGYQVCTMALWQR